MCMAAGLEPPAEIFVHGYLLMGGQKLGKTMIASGLAGGDGRRGAQDHRRVAPGPGRRLRRRPAALPPAARGPAGRRRRLLLRGHRGPLQLRPGQQPGQPGVPGHHRGPLEVRRRRARPATRPARWRAVAAACWRRRRRPGPAGRPTRRWRRPGGSSARPTPSSSRPSPGRWSPGPTVDAVLGDALEVLRIVAILIAPAMPSTAAEIWRRIGVAGDPSTAPVPDDAALGRLRRRRRRGEGRPPLPAPEGLTVSGWFDSHCHVQEEYLPEAMRRGDRPRRPCWPGPAQAGITRMVCIGTGVDHLGAGGGGGPGDGRGRSGAAGLGLRRAPSRTRPARASTRWPRCWRASWPPTTAWWWRSGSAGSTTSTSTRRATRNAAAFAAQIALAHAHELALVIHARDAWADLFDVLAPKACPNAPCCTASPAVPTRSSVACGPACSCRSAAS